MELKEHSNFYQMCIGILCIKGGTFEVPVEVNMTQNYPNEFIGGYR